MVDVELNRKHLEFLYQKYGDFHVVNKLGEKWRLVSQVLEKVPRTIRLNHREVLSNEVVFDFDLDNKEKILYYYGLLRSKMKRCGLSFEAWWTGGKGLHVQVIFDELNSLDTLDRTLMKNAIIDYFMIRGSANYAKQAKIDYQLCSRHLVRAEHGYHEKSQNYKHLHEKHDAIVKDANKIPSKAWSLFRQKKDYKPKFKPVMQSVGFVEMPFNCINYILSQDFAGNKDGRKRAMKILCNYYASIDPKNGIDRIREWNDYKLNGYFADERIMKCWDDIVEMHRTGKRFGCTFIRNLLKEFGKEDKVCSVCNVCKRKR